MEAEQLPPDPYQDRLRAVLLQVSTPNYPDGMIIWLETVSPRLYRMLTEDLPEHVHRLWSEHAPLEQFQAVVDRWLETHRSACALYRAYLAKVSKSRE